ncbi:hypothetical protein FB45DRAFT_901662 [Roridomyces roridus]|uniref:Acetyl-CoA synthetase-like protein n=1 Tax=Roridomyces roridus TaxID=1738132 RepID=A0AAD7C8P6_9AGAR|nr:hypothetical protein FB45DRAFT_901662 [Roridomyces roridus]
MSLYNFMFINSPSLEKPWFVDAATDRAVTGYQVRARVDRLAQGLNAQLGLGNKDYASSTPSHQDCGIKDVVGLVSPNSIDFGTVVWASHKLGCTVASINGGATAEELKHQFTLSGTRTIFAHIDALDKVIQAAEKAVIPLTRIVVISDEENFVLPSDFAERGILTADALVKLGGEQLSANPGSTLEVRLNPIAFLCFSSGTTGLPKAVIVPHASIIANVNQVRVAAVPGGRMSPGDKSLGVIPFSHMFGLVTLVHLCPFLGIATVAFNTMPSFKVFLEAIVRLRIGHLFLAPPLVSAFVKHPATPKYEQELKNVLRSAMVAAAPLDSEMESVFRKIGGPEFLVTQGFGMTECGGLITGLPAGSKPLPGSVGRLLEGTEAKIVGEDGQVLPPGSRGHLCVRGPQLCPGYLGNAQATREAFDGEGFLLTGDIAEISEEGYFHIVDRIKYMIKTKGYQVSPAELEAHLMGLDTVDDAGVIGRPDDRSGEVAVAFVVLSALGRNKAAANPDAVKESVMRSIRDTKSEYKWLHDVYFVQAIPRLPSGKISSKKLRAMLDGTVEEEAKIASPEAVVERPQPQLRGSLWGSSTSFFTRGADAVSSLLKQALY